MDDLNKSFVSTLTRLVLSIQQLNTLLVVDNEYFISNDRIKINESNEKKNQILVELSETLQELDKILIISVDGKKPTLTEYIRNLDKDSATCANQLLTTLYDSLSNGYNHLVTNNHVVVANLGFINSIWDSLLNIAKGDDSVYLKPELK